MSHLVRKDGIGIKMIIILISIPFLVCGCKKKKSRIETGITILFVPLISFCWFFFFSDDWKYINQKEHKKAQRYKNHPPYPKTFSTQKR